MGGPAGFGPQWAGSRVWCLATAVPQDRLREFQTVCGSRGVWVVFCFVWFKIDSTVSSQTWRSL